MLEKSVPFYIQVARILRQEILNGVYAVHSRMPEEKLLSARFGVSKDVIRVSMRLLAKEGLVKAIRSRGTFVCELPLQKGSQILLLSYHGPLHLQAIREGVEQAIGEDAYDLLLKTNSLSSLAAEKRILEGLKINELAAMVAAPSISLDGLDADNSSIYKRLVKCGLPLILVDHGLDSVPADTIVFDEYGSMKELMLRGLKVTNNRPAAMFIRESPHYRIANFRRQAMLDVAAEAGSDQLTVYSISTCFRDIAQTANVIFQTFMESEPRAKVLFFPDTMVAWEFYQKLRDAGQAGQIELLVALGDILRGDDDFNSKLLASYRLFDGFAPAIRRILSERLSGEASVGNVRRELLNFTFMEYDDVKQYFTRAMSRQII